MCVEHMHCKQLTLAIPAYNAEKYIRNCLESMCGLDDRLEIIVIDDGSTDRTADLARSFGDCVQVISKPNGGHGSGINMAIEHAGGRYFKVIDADDSIESANLKPLLDILETTEADAVVLGYRSIDITTGKVQSYSAQCKYANQVIGLEQLLEVYEEISSCCTFHGLCYRTEMYRTSKIRLSEGVYYEDQEYATLPFAFVETVLVLPIYLYLYTLGSEEQSVAFPNQVKRIKHIETVTKRILDYRKEHGPLTDAREEYFLRKLAIVAVSYFAVALVKNPDRAAGAADARRFQLWLANEAPELLARIEKKRKYVEYAIV